MGEENTVMAEPVVEANMMFETKAKPVELKQFTDRGWTRRCISCKFFTRKQTCKKMVSVHKSKMYQFIIQKPQQMGCEVWEYNK